MATILVKDAASAVKELQDLTGTQVSRWPRPENREVLWISCKVGSYVAGGGGLLWILKGGRKGAIKMMKKLQHFLYE